MLQALKDYWLGAEYVRNLKEVARQNRLAIRYLAIGGPPVGLANIAAQAIVRGTDLSVDRDAILLVYFFVLLLLDLFVIPQNLKHPTFLVYLIEAPIFLISILLGTIWDPAHQAITFLMFLIVMPVFVLDRPWRVTGVSTLWAALFMLMSYLSKTPEVFAADAIHASEFLISSLSVTFVVLKLRYEVIGNLGLTRYHLLHDQLTGAHNQAGFENHAADYLGKLLFVATGDVDRLTLLNEFYGSEVGNRVLQSLTNALKAAFGGRHIYRLGGDELACVGIGIDEESGLKLIDICREQLSKLEFDGVTTRVTYSFGYVVGTPMDVQTLSDMIRLASIYARKACSRGEGVSVGGPFSPETLRDNIAESSLTNYARSYEINQLTGFPSMAHFVDRVEELLSIPDFAYLHVVVGFLNVVSFREFNDRNGYTKGDELLRTLADLLREALPQRHIAYLSGSRFSVFCYKDEVDEAMRLISKGLHDYLPEQNIRIRAGFAEHKVGCSVISLIDQAKLAHDNVAPGAPSNYRYYDSELDRDLRLRQHLVASIDKAVEQRWLLVHYQPIMDAKTGKVSNFEALSRWNDPIYGLLPPYQFIGTLEDAGVIYKLSRGVVRQVLRDLKTVQKQGLPLVTVSVNLSRKDFFECDMVEEITAMVDEVELPHSVLAIEITESAFVEDIDFIKQEVERLRARGFAVWMDDFGSEYSSLNLLRELDFDLVKVDMQFMRDYFASSKNATIVSAIVSMCANLGMTTLVEGVEEQEQYQSLKEMGVDKLQGYLYSPPRALPDLLSIIKAKSWL